jgi:hypothetical protein
MIRLFLGARRAVALLLPLLFFIAIASADAPIRIEALSSNRITAIQPFPDGLLLGTARGVFALTGDATGRMIPGLDAFVFAMAEDQGVILVATETGAILLRQGTFRSVATPADWKSPSLVAVAGAGGLFIAGGGEGLITVSPEGVVKTRPGPSGHGGLIAAAAAPKGDQFLLAFEAGLYLFRPQSAEWIRLDAGRSYIALVLREDGRWFGLDRGGDLFTGRALPGDAPVRIEAMPEDDAALAIALRNADKTLLVGTLRGRVLAVRLEERRGRASIHRLLDDPRQIRPIRSLTVTTSGAIAAGTDGAGLVMIAIDGTVRQIVSKREARPSLAPAAEPDPRADLLRMIQEKAEDLLETAGRHRRILGGAVAAAFLALLVLYLAFSRAGGRGGQVREKRRASRTPLYIPSIEDLSPEIGALALRFMSITNEINELSRATAKSGAAEHAEKARRVTTSFEETERKMREHYAGLDALRVEHARRIDELKARIKAGESPDAASLQEELEAIERTMAQSMKDERYLRYVLEE